MISFDFDCRRIKLRVGTSIGHGEKAGANVLLREVLVGKLLAVDGLATGALKCKVTVSCRAGLWFAVGTERGNLRCRA